MNNEDYLKLDADAKYNFLNSELAAGKDFVQLLAEIGMSKEALGRDGFYYVKGKIMKKLFKGYQTPK